MNNGLILYVFDGSVSFDNAGECINGKKKVRMVSRCYVSCYSKNR